MKAAGESARITLTGESWVRILVSAYVWGPLPERLGGGSMELSAVFSNCVHGDLLLEVSEC